MTRLKTLLTALGLILFTSSAVQALPVIIPDFAVDPSGPAFTIAAIGPAEPGWINISVPPSLDFGATSIPDGTTDTLKMSWDPEIPGSEAQAGWELVFGADPDLTNQQIKLTVNPTGGWISGVGSLFAGIQHVEVRAIDNLGNLARGWGFDTDMSGFFIPVGSAPLVVLENNIMSDIVINVAATLAGSTVSVTPQGGAYGPAPFTGPNYTIAGNNNFANILSLEFWKTA